MFVRPRAAAAVHRAWGACCAALALFLTVASAPAGAFGFDDVAARAQALAKTSYVLPATRLPAELANLSYDGYRDIRFRPDHALWHAERLPFELMFFHLGKFQTQAVRINEIGPQGVKHVGFDPADFNYGANKLSPTTWGDLGYAGFRVHYALNGPKYKDELVVFLGASYLRALGAGQHYGLSARGLGIDTVGGQGEEFPRFTEFWIERPAADATTLTIHALLDSPRATGAYRFVVQPGQETAMDVTARLYLRAGVNTLGLAPLTSMFQHGENDPRPGEFRPEVHDSDGLLLQLGAADGTGNTAEWLWRPLQNPKRPLVTSFAARELKGFGLMQRDRVFDHYEDLEARYERRPSAWVTPKGPWGPGRVEMLQLHTPDETNDNIVAYWVPEKQPAPGQPLDFAYRLAWQGDVPEHPPTGWTVQTRVGHGYDTLAANEVQYVVDFAGPAFAALPADAAVEAVVTTGDNARLIERNAYRNDVTGGWRMTLRLQRLDVTKPVELRAFLQRGSQALSETWTTLIPSD